MLRRSKGRRSFGIFTNMRCSPFFSIARMPIPYFQKRQKTPLPLRRGAGGYFPLRFSSCIIVAPEWERHQKQTRYLLIGKERLEAEAWLKIEFKNEQPPCIPTDLHCEFICESIKNANNLLTQVF